jgi:DsbC/DsbD-like thiol-disulfide interchange protein
MPNWYFIFLLHFLPCNDQTGSDSVIKIAAPEVIAHAGKSAVIYVYVAVKEGYHIQANKVNDEFIIPTTLDINADKIIITGKQVFPAGKKFKLKGTSDYLFVYGGKFKIAIPFKVREKIRRGKYTLDAKLHYQACDDKTCFFPKSIDFFISVKVM